MDRAREKNSSIEISSPLERYLREINETALLTADQEKALARQIGVGCTTSRDQMVRANLRLVVNIARCYTGKGLALQNLIEEGNLGLLRAVDGFDPSMNTRFSTYASYWIKQSIKAALAAQKDKLLSQIVAITPEELADDETIRVKVRFLGQPGTTAAELAPHIRATYQALNEYTLAKYGKHLKLADFKRLVLQYAGVPA